MYSNLVSPKRPRWMMQSAQGCVLSRKEVSDQLWQWWQWQHQHGGTSDSHNRGGNPSDDALSWLGLSHQDPVNRSQNHIASAHSEKATSALRPEAFCGGGSEDGVGVGGGIGQKSILSVFLSCSPFWFWFCCCFFVLFFTFVCSLLIQLKCLTSKGAFRSTGIAGKRHHTWLFKCRFGGQN